MSKNLNLEEILTDVSSEDDLIEVPLTERVFHIFSGIFIIAVLIIFGQLFNLNVFNGNFYDRTASANFSKSEIERAPRGLIKDRYGEIIVDNEPSFKAFLSFNKMPSDEVERRGVLLEISELFNLDHEEFIDAVENHDWTTGRFPIVSNITHEELVSISSEDIPGLDIESRFKRVHYQPLAFSHIVGYTGLVTKDDIDEDPKLVSEDEIGKTGLETYYDKTLRGTNGRRVNILNAKGDVQNSSVVSEPERGQDLETFLDRDLQAYFHERLERQITNLGTEAGAVGIVSNPKTGEILSLVSLPSFENNSIAEYLNQPGQPFFNRAVEGLYNPGSTIKPLVAVAALEEGVVDDSDRFYSEGYLEIPNPYNPENPSIFLDWKKHGWVNIYSALARSSNVYFYIVGGGFEDRRGLGINRLNQWWKEFYLDKKTMIDLPGEKIGFLPDIEWKQKNTDSSWLLGDTYNVSIGQGDLSLTPLGLVNYINSIANKGDIMRLRVSKEQEQESLYNLKDKVKRSTFDIVEQGMIDAVEEDYGTANMLSNLPISVAGKTGSAEVGINKSRENAFFVGYGPVEDPEISVLVLIENSQQGSLNAVPVARDIFLWYYENRLNN